MSADVKNKCVGSVWSDYGLNPCGAKASLEHEGKLFCKRHHPPTVAAKKAAKHAAWNAERDAANAVRNKRDSEAAEQKRRSDLYADLLAALQDMLSGWRYIRDTHGDLYGVGWDRAQDKAEAAIAKATGSAA